MKLYTKNSLIAKIKRERKKAKKDPKLQEKTIKKTLGALFLVLGLGGK